MKILLEELIARYPNLALIEDEPIEWHYNMGFRGPNKLMVKLGA